MEIFLILMPDGVVYKVRRSNLEAALAAGGTPYQWTYTGGPMPVWPEWVPLGQKPSVSWLPWVVIGGVAALVVGVSLRRK
jgi:hypothetical protein